MVATRRGGPSQTKIEEFAEEQVVVSEETPSKRKNQKTAKSETPSKKVKTEDKDDAPDTTSPFRKDDKIDKQVKTEALDDDASPSKPEEPQHKKESPKDSQKEPGNKETSAAKGNVKGESAESETPVTTLKKSDDTDTHSEPIQINRAPVLTLFAACAAQLQHPSLSWPMCLSLGSAVSSICAISKGRAIGVIAESSDTGTRKSHDGEEVVRVLGFECHVKNGAAYVNDTKKPANEGYLKTKFGPRYEEVKKSMQESMQSWKGYEEEFERKGFRMYEHFRPGGGQWGAQGGLDVEEVKRAILK